MTENDKQLIQNLWDSGLSVQSIVQMLPYDEEISLKMVKELKKQGVLSRRSIKSRVINAYNLGVINPYELADLYGVTKGTIYNILSKSGVKRTRPKKNYKEREKTEIGCLCERTQNIISALQDGFTVNKICEMYDVSSQWVYSIKKVHIKGEKRK